MHESDRLLIDDGELDCDLCRIPRREVEHAGDGRDVESDDGVEASSDR